MEDHLPKTQNEQTKLAGFPVIAENPMLPVRALTAESAVSVAVATVSSEVA